MKLFTKEVDKQLFAQYPKGSDLENQMVVAKIFNPYGRGVWYLLNSDPQDPDYIWAIVDLFEPEMGSVSRSELQTVKVPPFGLGLERDIYFSPKPAKEVFEGVLRGERYEKGGSIASQNKDMLENQTANIMHHAKELHEAVKNTDIEIMPWVLTKIQRAATDLQDVSHYLEGEEAKFAAGGMTAGRWYKDNSGKEFRYIGESQGKLLFNDGEKVISKSEEDFEDSPKETKLFGFFADGGRVKGRNNETGESFGVVIGSVQKSDEFDGGGTQMNVRSSYGSRMSESTLYFDNNGNLISITDYGYGLEGNYPDTSGGSGRDYNADKKETLKVLSDKYTLAFAKRLVELAKGEKMAKGGGIYSSDSLYYLQVLKDGEEVGREKFRAKNLREAKEISEDDYEQKYINKFGNPLNFIVSEAMADGGEIETSAKRLADNPNWTNEKLQAEYDSNSRDLRNFNNGLLKPSKVIGGGYKSSAVAKRLAKEWLENTVATYKKALEIRGVMAKGGYMAMGGKTKGRETKEDNEIYEVIDKIYSDKDNRDRYGQVSVDKFEENKLEKLLSKDAFDYLKSHKSVYGGFITYGGRFGTYSALDLNLDKYIERKRQEIRMGKMGMGGKVKFEDKVKAVQKSLLKRKKVAPIVQKDYGKTYNKKEALESAKRIIGAQTAKWEKRNKK